jgi:hypothetical protein
MVQCMRVTIFFLAFLSEAVVVQMTRDLDADFLDHRLRIRLQAPNQAPVSEHEKMGCAQKHVFSLSQPCCHSISWC